MQDSGDWLSLVGRRTQRKRRCGFDCPGFQQERVSSSVALDSLGNSPGHESRGDQMKYCDSRRGCRCHAGKKSNRCNRERRPRHCDRSHIILSLLCGEQKRHNPINVKFWEVIADNLSKAGWSWGCVSALDSRGRTIWIADAHRHNGKRFIVRADEKLRAFLELQRVTRESFRSPNAE